ncbi:amino acid carrier protein [Synergistaceae bacterium OttesenSCG-928-I11]|nr:amino acid carrier protein [Synergistaceae bacterium OttesenSCG-928-I11]
MGLAKQVEALLEYVAWTVIWNKYFAIIFLVLGLYLSIGTRFFQFRRFGDIFYNTMGTLFRKKSGDATDKGSRISSFGAFATALGGTVGNGNIAGVASAIAIGGPGALFWMWMAALLAMVTKMSEIVLAQTYKQRYEDGSSYGSAAFYIQKALVEGRGWKWCKALSFIFTVTMIGSFYFAPGPYTIVEAVQSAFKLSGGTAIACAISYTAICYVIVLGGIPRIVKFAELAVPGMVVLYLAAGLFVILKDIPATLDAFRAIFVYAFKPHAAIGGFAGVTVMRAVQIGVARSVYSNEAGWGSSPIIHASVDVDHPARQGLWGAFEVFMDTIIVCSISGLMVIVTGAWETGRGGAGSIGEALSSVFGPFGGVALAFFLVIFSLTTTTGWFSYLESLIVYCVSKKTKEERMKYVKFVRYTGPLVPLCVSMFFFYHGTVPSTVFMMLDIQSGIPVYVNVIALTLLSPIIFKKIREFETNYLDPEKAARKAAKMSKAKTGSDPV